MSPEQQKPFMKQAARLLEDGAVRSAPEDGDGARPSPLTVASFAFLTFNAGMAVYHSSRHRAMGAASFGAVSFFLALALLVYCQRLYSRTPPGSSHRRENLKMAAWLLTTMLTCSAFMLLEFWFSEAMVDM